MTNTDPAAAPQDDFTAPPRAGFAAPPQRESLGALFKRLVDDLVNLVRSEFRLARSEVGIKLAQAASSLAAVAVGGMLAMVSTSCLIVAAIAWLAQRVGLVDAALIAAGVLALLGGGLIALGVAKLQRLDLAPKRAAANLKRNLDTLQGD